MSVEVKVPVLPESVADATVAAWHKNPGDAVSRDENLVDLETDKVVLEVPAPCDGVLESIAKPSGEVVTNDQVLGLIAEGAVAESSAQAEPAQEPAPETAQASATSSQDSPPAADSPAAAEPSTAPVEADPGDDLSPSVRRLVGEHGLDAAAIVGSGRDGRLTKEDVLRHLEEQSKPEPAASESKSAAPPAPPTVARTEERVPMSRLRQRIAERMVEANNTAAMLTSFNEVDLSSVMALRQQYKESFQQRHGVKLGFMSFFVKAAVKALNQYPIVNASIEGDDLVYHAFQDVGVAVSTDRGLVVPVLRDAGAMSFAEIESAIAGFAGKARSGGLKLEDLQGGTFTITNGGVFGSLVSTPILNMPQSAILGMHAIKDRPIAENGEVVIRPMMYLALTYDHRLVDGKDAVLFLVAIKDALEDPSRLLLDL